MSLVEEFGKAEKNLVFLFEIETSKRIDGLTWTPSGPASGIIVGAQRGIGMDRQPIKKFTPDLVFVAGQWDPTDLSFPWRLCCDGTYFYVTDMQAHRVVKYLASDLSVVWTHGSYGAGDEQFNYPRGICVDDTGTYFFVVDSYNNRVKKCLCSDGSLVAQVNTHLNGPGDICYLNGNLYVETLPSGAPDWYQIVHFLAIDLSLVEGWAGDAHFNNSVDAGLVAYGSKLYIAETSRGLMHRYALSPFLTWEATYGSFGSGDDQFQDNMGICIDPTGTYLYVCDGANYRIKKHLASDFSYVAQVGHYGAPANGEEFPYEPWGVCYAPAAGGTYSAISPVAVKPDEMAE